MRKQTLASILIVVCCAVVLGLKWLPADGYQAPWPVWIPIVGALVWSVWQLREQPGRPAKPFDFNPRRGILYFFFGFLIFPFLLATEAIFGTAISFATAGIVTLGGSLLIGIFGTFTENVGI